MKKIVFSLICLGWLAVEAVAQNPNYDQGLTVRRVFTDYQTLQGGTFSKFRAYRAAWEIGYRRLITDNLQVHVPLRAGVISTSGEEARNTSFIGLDAQAQYVWQKSDWRFRPYVTAGIGFVSEYNGDFVPQVPLGVGVFIKMTNRAYISAQTEYRLALSEDRNNLQHSLGFVYLFGPEEKSKVELPENEEMKPDSDGDGVPDEEDLCPNIAGLKEFTGCPDTDGDGIHDVLDKCPNIAGLKEMSGCPDSDGDGISDNNDNCPNMAGTISNNGCPQDDTDDDGDGIPNRLDECPFNKGAADLNGCPDADGDGVADKDDQCPNVKGTALNGGCPSVQDSDGDGIADNQDDCPDKAGLIQFNGCPDTDGDGVSDAKDACPSSAGPIDNQGCPSIAKEDRETLEVAMRAVQFDLGRSTLKTESFRILNQVADIMRRYPDYNLMISGHTDNSGSATINQRLSEKRAQTCYEYLISRGIKSSRLGFAGYGETRPMADNSTKEGRELNRRVEFDLIPAGR